MSLHIWEVQARNGGMYLKHQCLGGGGGGIKIQEPHKLLNEIEAMLRYKDPESKKIRKGKDRT